MGQGQSNNHGGTQQQQQQQELKTSYYDLLTLDRHATEEEIKKAYRRKALELHPDRNYGDVERTTALFAEIQAAYQVLSDPQERAWYDSHEDAILNDHPSAPTDDNASYERNVGLTSADDITRMFRKFHGKVDFTDAPSGFFGFLRDIFAQLDREETTAALRERATPPDYPSFGHKDDEYDDVVKAFYSSWAGFATCKTFAWRDRYRTSEADDRRTRRLMEKENKRFRSEGIAEFNDAVRSLIAFVRKRDPRYVPNTQSEADRQRVLREATAAQAVRMRKLNEERLNGLVPQWTQIRDPDEVEDISEEESDKEQYECVACRKLFKSEKQWEAHERSKKHIKAVQTLKKQLRKEGHDLNLDEDEPQSAEEQQVPSFARHEDSTSPADNDGSVIGEARKAPDAVLHPASDTDPQNINRRTSPLHTPHESSSDFEGIPSIKTSNSSAENLSDSDLSDPEHLSDMRNSHATINSIDTESTDLTAGAAPTLHSEPKLGKAAQKRAKRAAKQTDSSEEQMQKCAVCYAGFTSKTRLFQHIKDFGHAAPVAQSGVRTGSGTARGKKKR